MKFLPILISVMIVSASFAEDDMQEEQVSTKMIKQKKYLGHASYEYYTPKERSNYSPQGVNAGFQYNYKIKDTQAAMIMGPNLSYLYGEKFNVEEKIFFIKWDQGISYDFEVGKNMLLQPLAQVGFGHGWLNSNRPAGQSQYNENASTLEFVAGLNFIPAENLNVFAKGGYRFFKVDDFATQSTGELKGTLAMVGLGMGF